MGKYVAQVVTNARLVLGPPVFTEKGQKSQFWARFGIGGLPFNNWEKYGHSKTMGFINDYLTIFTPNLVG